MIGTKESRRHERRRLRGTVELSWALPGGTVSNVTGNCLDVSVYGMLVESPSLIPAGTTLQVRLQPSRMEGEAVVRHCRQNGPWFRIGLTFERALLLSENVPNIETTMVR